MDQSSGEHKLDAIVGDFVLMVLVILLNLALIVWAVNCCLRCFHKDVSSTENSCSQSQTFNVYKFMNDMEREKLIKFTCKELRVATNNFSKKLGSGGCGTVYLGNLSTGVNVAVKVLHESSDHKRVKQQFMAEVSTIGRAHHLNLVRLYGFCFEWKLRALVYEYVANGSLDKYLFHEGETLGFEKLHEIAVGTARGIAYLHEECPQQIVHYDIKPGNVLLDEKFSPKVADFGLAKLSNRENKHITITGGRGTPGYAAPELWFPFPVTHKCDVYSFGMLLFEIIGRRRNFDTSLPESQEWFPRWVWEKFDSGKLEELRIACRNEEKNMEIVERMSKVALWCVQYRSELRPLMSGVVRMLEGVVEIPKPLNPFQTMMVGTLPNQTNHPSDTTVSSGCGCATPILTILDVELASS
ncbi:G-type lectin S-receptor-like serine/threonine-protein kinase SD2-5 [Lotus japonicus]|uniref:G-type lectin S-receptor-like serine/threonine-protein kinase SD2-5 n=1 Tax=Lotus japonicus TaxID=34305 RepID=UPI002587C609|nr:G-type lectin S-receptor-like serine/threonine-protein kinase SD2-5 [Lotus japonicus]